MASRSPDPVLVVLVAGVALGCRQPDQTLRARVDENLRRIATAQQKRWTDAATHAAGNFEPLALKDFPGAAPWTTPVPSPRGPVALVPGPDGLVRERYETDQDPTGRERVLLAVLSTRGEKPKILATQRVPRWFEVRAVAPSGAGGSLECRALRVTLREEGDDPIIFLDEYTKCPVDRALPH